VIRALLCIYVCDCVYTRAAVSARRRERRELVFLATGECVREELRSVQIEIAADPLIYETDE
jgi:hypothetical protein